MAVTVDNSKKRSKVKTAPPVDLDYEALFAEAEQLAIVRVRLEGLPPGLLLHNGEAQLHNDRAKDEHVKAYAGRRAPKFVPAPEQEAEWGTYRRPDGELYLPFTNVQRMLYEAGLRHPDPADPKQTLARPVASAVTPGPDCELGYTLFDPFTDKLYSRPYREYDVDVRRAGLGKNGSVMRARPRLRDWACEIVLELDEVAIPARVLAELVKYGVKRVGLCDYRPWKGGPFGRAKVVSFEVER